ncbi:hypothetical protein GCM10023195_20690 [Actinoallomurus liliacearum]|uniref:CBM2 domain-containing protein n=1 Tax=Actinoallomurus liliacearum TaxID=1080073 RepID=A0ABP8TE31_9ACTN
MTAVNLSWNGHLRPGASAAVGFTGAWTGRNPVPTAFTLNGQKCGS